jgi:putative resolvase
MSDLIGVGDKARRLGVTVCTLRRWEKSGRLRPTARTLGGHRRYEIDPEEPATGNLTICYARVSSADQRDDLIRRIGWLPMPRREAGPMLRLSLTWARA